MSIGGRRGRPRRWFGRAGAGYALLTVMAFIVVVMLAGAAFFAVASYETRGAADFGSHDSHLHCGGTYRTGVDILPPAVQTEAEHYRGATYYEVRAWRQSGTVEARIFDAQGVDRTTALGDSLTGVVDYVSKTGTYVYAFDSASQVEHYFADTTGVFRRAAGDTAVVVNFGEPPLGDPTAFCDVIFESKGGGGAGRVRARAEGGVQGQ